MLSRKTFTLIEIIMVIIIIGILAVIAIPRFINMRRDASNAAAEANIAALRSAAGIYYGKTAIDRFQCLCVPNGATYNGITGCNAQRSTAVDSACYPSNIAELEGLLNGNLTWPTNISASCYNSTTGVVTSCM